MELHYTPEPLKTTLLRTSLIALAVGSAITALVSSQMESPNLVLPWVSFVAAVFWISFGGHWVELLYLRWWKCKFNFTGGKAILERVLFWMPFGAILFSAARATQIAIYKLEMVSTGSLIEAAISGMVLFVIVEVVVHTVLNCLKQDSMFNGRG